MGKTSNTENHETLQEKSEKTLIMETHCVHGSQGSILSNGNSPKNVSTDSTQYHTKPQQTFL